MVIRMKVIKLKIISVLLCFSLFASLLSLFCTADTSPTTEVIVLCESDTHKTHMLIEKRLSHCVLIDEYNTLTSGLLLEIKESELDVLKSVSGVRAVYKNTEYMPLAEDTPRTAYAPGTEPELNPDRGLGSVIAIIDNGFNLKHKEVELANANNSELLIKDIGNILNFTKAQKKYPFLKVKNVYKGEKVPFAFDYADNDFDVKTKQNHGTAMLSAAAGINLGLAPSAQVLAMKVYDDYGLTAKTSDVVAALEDAYLFGADVVNLSLGAACGFGEEGYYDPLLESTISSLEEKGVTVVCAAGNNGSMGKSTIFADYYGYDAPLVMHPDSGTVSTPSTIESTISVANASTEVGKYYAFMFADAFIPYSDSNPGFGERKDGKNPSFSEMFDGKTLEYVYVEGLGSIDDFAKLSGGALDGKIALIERGTIPFTEKVNNAAANGAVAAIIFDNTGKYSEALSTRMQLEGAEIPAILITNKDGKSLIDAEDKRISFEKGLTYVTNGGFPPTVSKTSSFGPTPTLDIKPELCAIGSGVTLASANGSYYTASGTSVSAAYTAGLVAGVCNMFSEFEGKDKVCAIKNYLMNSAEPMTDENGSFYSVNIQGAGLLDTRRLKENKIAITSNQKPKILLGNMRDADFDIPLTLKNNTSDTLEYSLYAYIGTTDYDEVLFSDLSSDKDAFYAEHGKFIYEYFDKSEDDSIYFSKNTISEFKNTVLTLENKDGTKYQDDSFIISLNPHETKQVTLNVSLDQNELEALSLIYQNGMFAEGYIFLEADEVYSIPLLGFIGDFYASSPLDTNLYEENGSMINGSYLYSYYSDDRFDGKIALGTNNLKNHSKAKKALSADLAVISPESLGAVDAIYLSFALLKNLKSLDIEIHSKDGELVCSPQKNNGIIKSYTETYADTPHTYDIMLWNFRSEHNTDYIFDDGKYICTLKATDIADNVHTQHFEFVLDSEKPEIVSYEVIKEDGKTYLCITVRDNYYLQGIYAQSFSGKDLEPVNDKLPDDTELISIGKGGEYTVTYDITSGVGSFIYLTVYDIAFNKILAKIEF